MTLKRYKGDLGQVVVLEHVSSILKDNPLGDPHVRKLAVWLPPQYDGLRGRRRFPVLYDLVGFTGSGLSHVAWKPFGDNVPERAARLISTTARASCRRAFPRRASAIATRNSTTTLRISITAWTSACRSCTVRSKLNREA